MSGHMTRMSRGSSVSSSASRPSSTSRRTSIWRAGPWQLCTCTERSSGLSVRPSRRTALAVMSDCSQPSSVSGRSSAGRGIRRSAVGGQAALQFAKVAAEGGQQRVADLAVAGVVAAGDQAVHAGERLPQIVAGVRQPQVKVVMGGQRVEQFDLGAGSRVWPNSEIRSGRSVGDSCSRGKRFGVPDVGRVGVDAVQQRAPQRRLPVEVRRRYRRSIVVLPVDEQLRPLPGIGGEEAGQPPRDGIAPAQPQLRSSPVSKWPRWVASVLHQPLVAAVVDDLEQRPDHRVG